MKEELFARLSRRYLALDIHKHYSVVAGVNFEGQVIVEPVRIEHADLESWLAKHIQSTDHVVIESTTNAWHIYDLLEPLAEKVLVANPIKVKQIATARVKTDIRDTLILARMLAANMIPAIQRFAQRSSDVARQQILLLYRIDEQCLNSNQTSCALFQQYWYRLHLPKEASSDTSDYEHCV